MKKCFFQSGEFAKKQLSHSTKPEEFQSNSKKISLFRKKLDPFCLKFIAKQHQGQAEKSEGSRCCKRIFLASLHLCPNISTLTESERLGSDPTKPDVLNFTRI
jgi:hypothetical protein